MPMHATSLLMLNKDSMISYDHEQRARRSAAVIVAEVDER
jgi:hypothetical protein